MLKVGKSRWLLSDNNVNNIDVILLIELKIYTTRNKNNPNKSKKWSKIN